VQAEPLSQRVGVKRVFGQFGEYAKFDRVSNAPRGGCVNQRASSFCRHRDEQTHVD
jgi:hypothetical protein